MKPLLTLLLLLACLPVFGVDPVSIRSTNGVSTALTNYGSTGRTNSYWMDAAGWHATNNSAVNQGVDISKGQVKIGGRGPTDTMLSVSGTNFVVLTNGNAGIGTATPLVQLEVTGPTYFYGARAPATATYPGVFSAFQPTTANVGDTAWYLQGPTVAGAYNGITARATASGTFLQEFDNQGAGDCRVRILCEGAGDPNLKFEVSGGGRFVIGIDNSDNDSFKISTGSSIGSGDVVTIDATGNVGINTTTPQEKLHVIGNATIKTNAYIGGVMTATNGVGSLAADATVNITASGWTNTFGKTAVVYLDGTAVTFSIKNNAGTSIYTNAVSLTGEATVILQPGGAVLTSGTGVAGRATPF